jgi:hypothetical protein
MLIYVLYVNSEPLCCDPCVNMDGNKCYILYIYSSQAGQDSVRQWQELAHGVVTQYIISSHSMYNVSCRSVIIEDISILLLNSILALILNLTCKVRGYLQLLTKNKSKSIGYMGKGKCGWNTVSPDHTFNVTKPTVNMSYCKLILPMTKLIVCIVCLLQGWDKILI